MRFSRLGFDYRHLMDEKRRIGYTGPGLSKFTFLIWEKNHLINFLLIQLFLNEPKSMKFSWKISMYHLVSGCTNTFDSTYVLILLPFSFLHRSSLSLPFKARRTLSRELERTSIRSWTIRSKRSSNHRSSNKPFQSPNHSYSRRTKISSTDSFTSPFPFHLVIRR